MSFILDALKKSESERQRQSGPALFEVKVAPPRSRWPVWAGLLAALLVLNLGVVAWLLLRTPERALPAPAQQANTTPPATATPQVATPQPAAPPAVAPPAPRQSVPEARTANGYPPATDVPDDVFAERAPFAMDDLAVEEEIDPDDYAPAVMPPAAPPASRVMRATASGLPTYEDVAASTSIPELRLDLHVFAERPRERFVFVNMSRLREGESLPNGVRVEEITVDGVVLSYRGRRFVLLKD